MYFGQCSGVGACCDNALDGALAHWYGNECTDGNSASRSIGKRLIARECNAYERYDGEQVGGVLCWRWHRCVLEYLRRDWYDDK